MKTSTIKCFFYALVLVIFSFTAHALNWTQKANFNPGNRYGAFGFSIGNYGYVGNGTIQNGFNYTLATDFWQYDPVNDSWTQKAAIPTIGRIGAATFVVNDKGYVTTGNDYITYLDDLWEYDPATNIWTQKASFPGGQRHTCASFTVNDYGFVGMGRNTGYFSDFYRYNVLSDTWTSVSPIPGTDRQSAKGYTINGYGYVVGGANDLNAYDSKETYRYEPIGDTWLQVADYPGNGSHGLAAFVISDIAYVGTGTMLTASSNNVYDDLYSYNPTNDTWTQVANFTGGFRQGTVSMTIGNKGYMGLGSSVIFPSMNYFSDWWTLEEPLGIDEADMISNGVNVFIDNQNNLQIQLSRPDDLLQKVELFNSAGQLIQTGNINARSQQAIINMPETATGIYYYQIKGGMKEFTGKVIFIE